MEIEHSIPTLGMLHKGTGQCPYIKHHKENIAGNIGIRNFFDDTDKDVGDDL